MKSRALSGLAVLVAGALVAVFTVPRGTSDAATPANQVGATANNPLTVNVQEIDPDSDGAAIFNLTEYGNLDWFHLTGVPCSFPYHAPGTAPFDYCQDSDGGTIDRRGGYRAVELKNPKGGGLSWGRLFDEGSAEPDAQTAYAGVYESPSAVTYTWDELDGVASTSPALAATGWSTPDSYTPAPQRPGTSLGGAFYDPDSYPGYSGPDIDGGYKISVAHGSNANRVLRFVGGVSNATAAIAVEAVDSSGATVAPSVDFYPGAWHAQGDAVTALHTVYIPAGYGANIEVTVDSADPDGYVTLGGAALSGDLAPGGSPLANAKLAFTSSLVRPLTVDTLDAPADFNLSDPGGTEEIVDAWRHAAITEYTLPSVVEARYATYTLYTGQGTLEFEFPKEAGSAYVPCEGEYYRPRYDGTVEEGGGDRTNPNDPLAASLPAGHVASWSFASSFGSYGSPYAGSTGETDEPPVKTALAVATARCAGAAKSGMARVVVGTSGTKDRYLYVLIGGLGGDYYATATFGQGGTQVSVESSVVARPAEGDPAAMSLYRVLVPAGATGNVTFSMAENPAPDQDATLIIGGASIQRIPDWGGCEVSAEFKWGKLLTGSQDDNQEYKDEDLALAPYFQQFQLRGLLNTVDLTDLPMSAFDQGRLSAAYCEAKAWPDEEVDLESGEMRDRLHPAQNGYGEENGNETPESGIVRFDQEDDEAQGLDGDETDPGAQDKSKLKQPMVKLTKRAFTCDEAAESPIADGAIDPNKLIKWDPESQTEKAADGCHEVTNAVAINSGTRVYWVFTVVNIGLFGAIYVPESGTFTVEDYVNSSSDPESCDLKWELTAASTPAGVPRFEVHTIAEEYLGKPIWPTQGRVCVSSEVVW